MAMIKPITVIEFGDNPNEANKDPILSRIG
jgi:hypothetical protein